MRCFAHLRFLAAVALVFSLFTGCGKHVTISGKLRPLNVLIVTIDTVRADHVGCYGYKQAETPNLDRLAASGALFENAIAQAPLTPPSHASIFTGLNPTVHNVRDIGGFVLSPSHKTLATMFREAGWKTAAFVGASVLKRQSGLDQGFDVYDDEMPRPEPGMALPEQAERPAGVVVDRALAWLKQQPAGSRWFLWVHVYDPHAPHIAPPEFRERFKDRPYDGEIAYADRELGRLFNVAKGAVIAVLSDHGESLSDHGEFTHGVFLYDSTLRIPFVLSGPGVPAGTRVKEQVRTIDLAPTLLDLLGGTVPSEVQGVSLVTSLRGHGEETLAYSETLFPKIHMGWSELRSLRSSKWKYIRAPRPELYDLSSDPAELHNLAAGRPGQVKLFEDRLAALAGDHIIHTSAINEQTLRELRSLGYLAGDSGREFELNGTGIDPKDRIAVLKLLEEAVAPGTRATVEERIVLLRKAQSIDPTNPEVLDQLGETYQNAHQYDKALNTYELAIKNGVESARIYSRIGNLKVRLGKRGDAIVAYERAMHFNPSDIETQSNLATAYVESGRLGDAEQICKRILVLNPQYAPAHNALGIIAIQRGDASAARAHFERAIELNPDLAEAWLNLGLLYKQTGEPVRARAAFSRFISVAPRSGYAGLVRKVQKEIASLQ